MNIRVFLFSLGVACLAVAGYQQPAAVPNNTFHLTVEQVITNSEILVSLLKIEASQDAYLSVTNEKSSLSVLMTGTSNGAVRSGQVAFSASRFRRPGDEYAQVQLYEQAQAGGGSVSGSSGQSLPAATELAGYFSLSAADGDYPLDSPMQIGELAGNPVMLTVGKPPKAGQ